MNTARRYLPATLLALATALWAGLPFLNAGPLDKPGFLLALGCAAFGALRLLAEATARSRPALSERMYQSPTTRAYLSGVSVLEGIPWPQLLIIAAVGLEALHPRRPWHTAVLAVVLIGYLITVHLAESNSRLAVFRPQLPLLIAGVALTAISVGAAALPAEAGGNGSGWLAVLAAIAAVIAAALALPI